MILGHGSYGEVEARDGKAVKKFGKRTYLIQEDLALRYLHDCEYIVHTKGVDYNNLELYMELYDCSLRIWLQDQIEKGGADVSDIMKILHDMLLGLVELHDRGLAHGDLKPGNVLIRTNPLKAVIGDCGFVSIAKYAKVRRTAKVYRDPIINHDRSHDMFSFGICFLEMIAGIKIIREASYNELSQVIHEKVEDKEHRKIIHNLLHEDKKRRPSARAVLRLLFNISPNKWIIPDNIIDKRSDDGKMLISISRRNIDIIRDIMKNVTYENNIRRGKKGYGALIYYLDHYKISPDLYTLYAGITIMILSSIFGKSGFDENAIIHLCNKNYNSEYINKILDNMLSDNTYINILLMPK